MNGMGTTAPMIADVPVTLVPTLPADFADFRSHTVASYADSFSHQPKPMHPAAPGAAPHAMLPPPSVFCVLPSSQTT